MTVLITFIITLIIIMIFAIAKFGRERTLSIISKVLSPICIIIFYLSDLSIICLIFNILNISNSTIINNPSIRVAIDSAIITLFINFFMEVLNYIVKINIDSRSPVDMNEIQTYTDKPIHVQCNVLIDYKKKSIKKLCDNHCNIILKIKNSTFTTIVIDRAEEYGDCINSENSSKEIKVNLNKISNSDKNFVKAYFTLVIMSNKSIKVSDYITYDISFENKFMNILKKLFVSIEAESINVIHKGERQNG